MPRPAKKTRFRRAMWWVLGTLAILLITPVLQVALASIWNPSWSPMQFQRRMEAGWSGKKWPEVPRCWTPIEQIPVELIHYIWASEDQAFFQHDGFDLPQMRLALAEARKTGKGIRGSSTITMQCARSVFLWQGRSYVRKALEAYYTVWMELLLSKPRILELYLNNIELGPGIYGVGAASDEYFGKKPAQLSDRQMISLAAILPNPLEWSPVKPTETVLRKIRRIERLSSRAPFPEDQLE